MKAGVIGGTGLIGSKVAAKLDQHGHEPIAATPDTGANTLTGEGLAVVLTGAQVVVDVANSPSVDDGPAWDFFTTATGNVLTAAKAAARQRLLPREEGARTAHLRGRRPVLDRERDAVLRVRGSHRIVTDPQARYFGMVLDNHTLVPATTATVFPASCTDWLIDKGPAPVG